MSVKQHLACNWAVLFASGDKQPLAFSWAVLFTSGDKQLLASAELYSLLLVINNP